MKTTKQNKDIGLRWIIVLCFVSALLFNTSQMLSYPRLSYFFEVCNLLVMINIIQWIK